MVEIEMPQGPLVLGLVAVDLSRRRAARISPGVPFATDRGLRSKP